MKNRLKMKALLSSGIGVLFLFFLTFPAHAALINFNATGLAGVSGYVEFDDTNFSGSGIDYILNADINDFYLDVFGDVFTLADVVPSDYTLIDSSGAIETIFNGAGLLASSSLGSLAFFPDDFSNSGSDGDASLAVSQIENANVGNWDLWSFYMVAWEVGPKSAPVPEPATMLLLGSGLVGLAGFGRKKFKK